MTPKKEGIDSNGSLGCHFTALHRHAVAIVIFNSGSGLSSHFGYFSSFIIYFFQVCGVSIVGFGGKSLCRHKKLTY